MQDDFDVVVGVVDRLNEQPSTDRDGRQTGEYVVWLTLAGGVRMMAQRARANEFPGVGEMAAFASQSSRSGKMAMIRAWGWPDAKEKGALKQSSLVVNYVWQQEQSQPDTSIGMRRQ